MSETVGVAIVLGGVLVFILCMAVANAGLEGVIDVFTRSARDRRSQPMTFVTSLNQREAEAAIRSAAARISCEVSNRSPAGDLLTVRLDNSGSAETRLTSQSGGSRIRVTPSGRSTNTERFAQFRGSLLAELRALDQNVRSIAV